jgi:integrase
MSIEQSSLILRPRAGSGERVFWDAQWRYRTVAGEPWKFKKQRLGLAWLEPDGKGWRKRKGRCREGWLDQRAANIAADRAMKEHAQTLASAGERERLERERLVTVREVAHEWLKWLGQVRGSKPSTLRDYETLLREPGQPHKRGKGVSEGRIMATFGDKPAAKVTTKAVTKFLRSLDAEDFTPRNVNKYRQVLQGIFAYASRDDTFALPGGNPVDATDKRREPSPPALDYYEVEEVEALARVCERGEHRRTSAVEAAEREARAAEDRQDAEAFRILFYTGIRSGELLTIRRSDVDLEARLLLIRRNLSAGVETEPKGRRHRYVPLSDPALGALARLLTRGDFTGDDDYVLCNRWGRRLDLSALRRRYRRACEVAGLRRVKLHGLRHAAGSILARTTDAVGVRDFLGHSKLSTTDRYVGAKHRPEDFERLNRAFASSAGDSPPVASPLQEVFDLGA